MSDGTLCIVLHAHLPFIRHPEGERFYEESWLYEAVAETYVPLLRMMDNLWTDGIDFRLTMGVTPPLAEMLADPLLMERFEERLEKLQHIAGTQADRWSGTDMESAAQWMVRELEDIDDVIGRWGGSILRGFETMQARGRLELITCAATHGYLPLMATDEGRRAQVEIALDTHERHFGSRPRGIWMPECAYAPGLDALLADCGLQYTFMEKHGVLNGLPSPRYGTARPIVTPAGLACFPRDPECSNQVWSADSGYPGDPEYREFYRDLGWEAEWSLVKDLMGADQRVPIGLKYHRITGRGSDFKAPWVPSRADARASAHAENFLHNRQNQLSHLASIMDLEPVVVAPFDAELFGHWWAEGPWFLEYFFRKTACDQDQIRLSTPGEVLDRDPILEVIEPSQSSWGDKGYYEVWLQSINAWVYPHLHRAEERMVELCDRFPEASGLQKRMLDQAGRELLLAQSSDWAFLISTRTAGEYPATRTASHLKRFMALYQQLVDEAPDEVFLAECEERDNCFPDLDYRSWSSEKVRVRGGSAVTTAIG